MKLQEALERIVDVHGAWRVAFDLMDDDGDVTIPDHFPDVEDGEDPFTHEEDAMRMRDKFAAANTVCVTNCRVQTSNDGGKTWVDTLPVRNVPPPAELPPPDGSPVKVDEPPTSA